MKNPTKTLVIAGSTLMVFGATALPGSANFLLGSLPLSLLEGSLPTSLLGGPFPTSLLGNSFSTSFLPSSFSPINTLLSQVTGRQTQFMSFFNDFQTSLTAWGEQLTGQSVSVTLGPLGLPDLGSFELDLDGTFTNHGEYITLDEAQHTGVRQVTRTHARQTFSRPGQQALLERQTQITDGVTELDNQAIAAQFTYGTQNLLKRMAIQNAQQGMLLGTVGSELTNLSVKQDLANYNLANISEGIDSQNLAKQTDMEGASLRILETSSLLRMD